MNTKHDPVEQMLRTLRTLPEAQPRDEFSRNARIRILNTLDAKAPVPPVRGRMAWWSYHAARWAGGTVLASFLLGSGVVYAAQYSTPGSALYPVKTASEKAAILLAPTKSLKTSVAGTMIDRRAKEYEDAKSAGDQGAVQQARTSYEQTVRELEDDAGLDTEQVSDHIREHERLFGSDGKVEGATTVREDGEQDFHEGGGDRGEPSGPAPVRTEEGGNPENSMNGSEVQTGGTLNVQESLQQQTETHQEKSSQESSRDSGHDSD